MPDLTLLQRTSSYTIAIVILILVLLFYWIGYRLRKRAIQIDPDHVKVDVKTINGMLIGLLGLLLAFTFSMANSRFDDRRRHIIEESNIIGTTILRTDMYPDSVRELLRSALSDYVERRIAYYEARLDGEKVAAEYQAGQALSARVWHIAAEYAKRDDITTRTSQLIPSINEMIDITSTRLAAGRGTIPDSIMYFLFAVSVCVAFLLGYDNNGKFDWIIVLGLSVTVAATIFTIVDLDRPRSGLINMDEPHKNIVGLRQMFTE
jgi:hypothetical protein